jgi:DNA recombination protein RmuC
MQSACNQALLSTQQTFLTLLEPVLSGVQNHTQAQLKEHSTFLHTLCSPLEAKLKEMETHIHSLEQSRSGAYESLKEQISHLSQGHEALCTETNRLNTALRSPHVRGCWGEMQLKRVVELAGMSSHCDFQEQPQLHGEQQNFRPDMRILLPGGKTILVDAKAPLLHYLEASSCKTSQDHTLKLKEHARTLWIHIKALSEKSYWSHDPHSVEFVLLFLPGEAFLSAALEGDPSLVEAAAQRQIILATPIILIALLKTIAHGWRQEVVSQHTQRIITLSKELHQRLEKLSPIMKTLGRHLKQSAAAHALAASSLEESLLPTAKQLGGLVPEPEVLSLQPMGVE